jgi:hypothetical protein
VQRRVEDYRGRVVAVDASLSIYQFLVSPRRRALSSLLLSFPFAAVGATGRSPLSRRRVWVA